MCCSTKEGVFTWISALLVNIAFLSLITWGANEYWPFGMGLTAIYTLSLLHIATKIDVKQRPTSTEPLGHAAGDEAEDGEEEEDHETSHRRIEKVIMDDDLDLSIASAKREDVSSLVNLLYFLSVISLGVTGFFLVVNLVPSCGDIIGTHPYYPKYNWEPNLETIPSSVQDWATDKNQAEQGGNSFGYVRSTGITLFHGSSNNAYAPGSSKMPLSTGEMYQDIASMPFLWTVSNSNPPELAEGGFSYPGPMVTVTDNAVCFSAVRVGNVEDSTTSYFGPQRKLQAMYCSDGVEFHQETFNVTAADDEGAQAHLATLTAFYPVDGILWFKELDYGRVSGTKIYSLDPVTVTSTLHSYKVEDSSSKRTNADTSCDEGHMNRIAAIASLVVSILPMTALTFLLGKKTKVPSMGVSAYLCVSLIYASLHILVSPNEGEYMPSSFRVWFAISGLACLLLSTYLLLTLHQHDSNAPRCVDKSHEKQFRSLLGISAAAFSWGTVVVLLADVFKERETFAVWFCFNLLVCCPLLLVGAAADSTFVLAWGGLGFLADAARLASLIDSVLFFFLVFSLMGLMVGCLGYYFAVQCQPIIQKWAYEQVTIINDKYCSSASDPYGLEDFDYGDEDTNPLALRTVDPTVHVI